MLYRMLTGEYPFPEGKGKWSAEPGTPRRLDVPGAPVLAELVERMLDRTPKGRPRDGAHLPEWVLTGVLALLPLGSPVAVILAWIHDLTEHGVKRSPSTTGAPLFRSSRLLIPLATSVAVLGAEARRRLRRGAAGDRPGAGRVPVHAPGDGHRQGRDHAPHRSALRADPDLAFRSLSDDYPQEKFFALFAGLASDTPAARKEFLDRALAIDPAFVWPVYLLAEEDEKLPLAQRAVELRPDFFATQFNYALAWAYKLAGLDDRAKALAEKLPPEGMGREMWIAATALRGGRSAEAIPRFTEAIEERGFRNPTCAYMLGRLLADAGRCRDAVVEFDRVASQFPWAFLQPSMFGTWMPLSLLEGARCQAKLGRPDEARARLDRLLAMWKDADPDLPALAEAKAMRARLGVVPK